ncbi:putative succinyl-CoA:3-ketoacid coenzyme A transferase subunit B [subsurface metagenome]
MIKTGSLAFGDDVDQDLINASCQPVTALPGTAIFDIVESFNMIRGGYMDVIVVGGLQVSVTGDCAGWANPTRGLDVGNIGGSMDLAAGAHKVLVCMEHGVSPG